MLGGDSKMDAFLGEALAAFVGTGAAITTLRALSDTAIGHWLAKGLARYTAKVETEEVSKRTVLQRLDRDRTAFVQRIMNDAAEINVKCLYPIVGGEPHELRTRGPEVLHLELYGQLCLAVREVGKAAAGSAYPYDKREPLPHLVTSWALALHGELNDFHDRIVEITDANDRVHWTLPIAERIQRLETIKQQMLGAPAAAAFALLLERCRDLAQGR